MSKTKWKNKKKWLKSKELDRSNLEATIITAIAILLPKQAKPKNLNKVISYHINFSKLLKPQLRQW